VETHRPSDGPSPSDASTQRTERLLAPLAAMVRPGEAGWTGLTWGLLILIALIPVAILGLYSLNTATRSIHELVRDNNVAAATASSEVVDEHLRATLNLARTFAALPGMAEAVEQHDEDAVRLRLEPVYESYTDIDRVIIMDTKGILWSDYPRAPESLGHSFAHRDYFRGVITSGKTYVSEVFLRNASPRHLVVGLSAPIRDAQQRLIGVLVCQMNLQTITDWLRDIKVGEGGYMVVLDQNGALAAHPKISLETNTNTATNTYTDYAALAPVKTALTGTPVSTEYDDPLAHRRMVATFQPIRAGRSFWVVIAQQPRDLAYAPIDRLRLHIALAGAITTAVSTVMALALGRISRRSNMLRQQLAIHNVQLEQLAEDLKKAAEAERAAHQASDKAHAELQDAQLRMVQSEKLASLGQLVAGVAHEINNPLAFVTNNVAVLQRDVTGISDLLQQYRASHAALLQANPQAAAQITELADRVDLAYVMENLPEMFVRSREGLRRIQQIVKDLRDFARQDTVGELASNIDLNTGIESTINIVRGRARKQDVELHSDLGRLAGIECYPARINQVVLNLLVNAIDACPEKGHVTITSRMDDLGVVIEVRDTGHGIPPAIREKIFDPFFTTKPQGHGTGLGLSISHGIVLDHGGTIEVESEVGKGACFRVRLPRKPPPKMTND
jgi:signal transduction histidine kinase